MVKVSDLLAAQHPSDTSICHCISAAILAAHQDAVFLLRIAWQCEALQHLSVLVYGDQVFARSSHRVAII